MRPHRHIQVDINQLCCIAFSLQRTTLYGSTCSMRRQLELQHEEQFKELIAKKTANIKQDELTYYLPV